MRLTSRLAALLCLFTIVFCIGRLSVEAAPQDEKKAPSQAEIMKRDQQQRTRGAEHAELAKRVGNWDVAYNFVMYNGMKVKGSAVCELVLGGNFLHTKIKANMMGQPMESWSFSGYDTLAKEHIYFAMDNVYTLATEMRGQKKDDTIAYRGIMKDSMSPQGRLFRAEEKRVSDDEFVVTVYDGSDDPEKEFVVMTLTFTRAEDADEKKGD